MRYTSHLLVIWEAKSRILFSKYSQTMLLCKDVGIFEVCIRRSPNTYNKTQCSRSVAQIVVAYFIQDCEVYGKISR